MLAKPLRGRRRLPGELAILIGAQTAIASPLLAAWLAARNAPVLAAILLSAGCWPAPVIIAMMIHQMAEPMPAGQPEPGP